MEKIKKEHIKYKFKHYKGSLDFPCDFCSTNSYDNFHISRDDVLIVFCKNCFDKLIYKGGKK